MSIKSDKWIRRMAEQHGMIEPFEPGQVRHAADGHKIVSYGTSSYGYDIRCAPEFKVFTNIYSTVVDPKNFDERSFGPEHGRLGRLRNQHRHGCGEPPCARDEPASGARVTRECAGAAFPVAVGRPGWQGPSSILRHPETRRRSGNWRRWN